MPYAYRWPYAYRCVLPLHIESRWLPSKACVSFLAGKRVKDSVWSWVTQAYVSFLVGKLLPSTFRRKTGIVATSQAESAMAVREEERARGYEEAIPGTPLLRGGQNRESGP